MDFSWDDVEPVAAPTGETGFSWNDVEEPQAKAEPTWDGGDGKPAALPEGETNEWGGNLRNEGRKVLIRRGENGKVNGYSTTSSMIVKDEDGKIAVIPTVVDGKELSPDEAVKHYAKTGEHWGKADDEDSAREIARKVHERHEEDNRKGWNDYIHSHWDEMDDSIRNDRGTAYEHRKREDPDSITDMERLAHDDTSKERFHRQYKAGRKEGEDAAADMDDLAEIAKGAGLEDWQVERIRRESKDAEEMRKNLAYVAGNRVGNETGHGKKGGKLTDYIRSAAGAVSHAILDRIPDITKAAGTALGGKSDETQSFMTDDQYARKEGEDVRQWARRKGIHLNRKNFDAWNEFFKWEAPIEGKEGMRPSKSLMSPGRGENRSTMERIGDELVKIGNQEQADIDRIIPRHLTGNPVMNFIEDTASGVGGFMFAGPLMVGTAYGSSYQSTRDYALQNGATPEQADALGKGAGVIDTALTAAFYRAPVRKWMKSKGIAPVMDPVKNHSFSEMSRAVGNFAMKKVALEQSAAALEAGAILGIQGAADEAIRLKAEGKDLDTLGSVGDIAISGIEGAVSGAGVGLVMGGAHLLGARANARRAYRDTLREVIRPEAGNAAKEEAAVLFRQRLAELNPEATADFCEAFERGSVATKKQVDAAGLPPMSVVERGQYWELLKAQGITSESIRKNAKLGTTAEGGAAPEAPVAPEVPPSYTLFGKIEEMGGEPVRFSIPQDENGKPRFTTMAWRDNRTGKEGKNRIAIDERTQVAIMDNGDGTFTAYDNLQNAVDSDNLDDAIENANELALAQQYTNIERQKKLQVIENAHASKFGEKNVVAFPTMADAVNQIGNSIRQGDPIFGITSISGFTNPRNGFREDRKGFTTPDGTTVLIVDNIDDPADVERLLRHETIGHGGPNSEFGNGVDDFLSSLGSDEFSRRRGDLIKSGMSPEEADSKRGKREIFANMLQEREHNPTVRQRLGSWLNGRARQMKLKKTYSDADIEVMASRWEKEARGTNGDLDLREPGDRFEFIELEDEAPRETHENAPVSAPKKTTATSRPEAAKPVEKREPAKSEPSKPVSERNIVEKLTDKAEAQEIPLSEIEVSDSRIPQFKEGADPETGEVEPLTGEPYDLVSNPIVVMEFKDGKKVVVTGRHRYGLYKRSGRKTIAARVIRESDGWNVKDAMAIDAIGNIIDEKGTEKDYVKYFDEAKPSHEEARVAGFLDRPKGQRAFSIYEGATEDTKQLIDWEGAGGDGKISVDQAGIISSAAPKNANKRFGAVQRILTQKALGGLRGKKLGILARSLAEEAKNRKDTPSVSGEMQLDLFTSEEDQALLAMEDRRADYRVRKAGEYGRVAEVLRTAISKGGKLELNEEYAKELGITDPKDRQQLIAARDKAVERANYWENAIVLEPADKSAMDDEITAKDKAATEKREAIKAKAEEKLAAVKAKRAGKKPVKTPVKSREEELTGQEKARSAANAAFSAMTGIPVVQVGKNGKILSDSTPAAEKAISGKGDGKSAVKSAEPKTKMKDAASEAKAQKLEDDLGALFMSEEYDPSAPKKEVSKWRKFDVKKPDGEKGSVHAYTMRQAQGAAKKKYGIGSAVYEQGGLENAIIREREGRARDRIGSVHAQYPVGTGLLGPDFDRAVTASVDGGSAQQVASLLVSAQRGRDLRHSVFAIGRRDKLTDSSGASHYTDGTVVVPLHDGKSSDPFKFNRELLKVLANAEAFGELKDIEFLRGNEGRIYGMVSGKPVVRRVNPSESEVAKFLESKGFKSIAVSSRYPGMVWGKGNVNVNQNDLRFGSAPDGSLVPLFSDKIGTHSEAGLNFASGEFDPAMFQKRVGVLAELAKTYADNGVGTFETLADRMYAKFADKFDAMKPYLRGIWNAVAEQLDLPEVTREQANDVFARIEKPSENEPTVERPTEKALTKGERISNAADKLVALIEKGEKFDRRTLEETVAKHLGGSVAEGTFTPKDASDILELAVNRVVLKRKGELSASANASVDEAVGAIGEIRKILGVLPTQTVRSDEQIKMQQFSTPPHEAFAVNWVANIRPGDVALEPSAGIGGIAVFAKASGARKIVANELSDRRREILNELGIADNLYGVDAAKIWQHLFWEVNKGNAERPTVVVMNPPFSSSVVSGRHSTIGVGGAHIEAALDSLAQGGRLVAVVGNGMSYDSPSKSAAAWWKKIGSKYRVMANVRVNGNEYAKYGTDFDNNIIVIDKVEPDPTVKPVFGKIESLDDFPALMEGVRNARPGSNRQTEPASDKQGGRGGNETRAAGLVSVGKPEQPDGRTGNSQSDAGIVGGRRGENPGSSRGSREGLDRTNPATGNVRGGNQNSSGQGGRKGNAAGRDRLDNVSSGRDELGEAGGRAGDGAGLLAVSDLKSENPQGENEEVRTVGDGTFAEYKPSKLNIPGMKPHPGEIVESAAMASVKTPDITYSPRISKELVEKGQPSAAQLEVITLAGQAGEQKLPNGQRRGFFTQDGTGMGKGTEISGVICDNFNHGRKKAIWISKNKKLFPDAQRDLSTYGLEKEVFWFSKDEAKKGNIAFLSYDTLVDNASVTDKGNVVPSKGDSCNFTKLVEWFGKDYDGVIVFDESHMMANVEGKKTKRGTSEGAQRAKIAVKLQELLPNARVLYASATGATEVSHLACLPRLGLWGEGTSFKTKGEFIDKISSGGLSMMEMVARDMKASGLTLSRSLTMEGIVNRPLVHNLSPDQTRVYDTCAGAWQEIYDNIFDTIASTGEIHNGTDVGKIIGAMKGAQQRFFNSLLTSMMMPSVISDIKRNLADGKSIVIQLTQTNEAAMNKAIAKGRGDENFSAEEIDTSPRTVLRGYVEHSFPTFVYTEVEDENGKKSWRVAEDSEGKRLQDPAALERKQALLDKIDMMNLDKSPLDRILEEFGYDKVAEVTGRTKRIETREENGEIKTVIASHSSKKGEAETAEFNAGKRRILIFSEAGGTGKSYHASRTFENQQQRIHYLLQAGWSAPPAIQGLGRTNRTNQASKPEYVLCTTDVKGHLRFISSVARRLQQMGSLTSGDRSTAGNGVFNEDQNIEDVYSKRALVKIFTELFHDNPSEFTRVSRMMGFVRPKVDTETGERSEYNKLIDPETGGLDNEKIPDVTEFLNIMLHLRIADMNRFFDQFMQTRNDLIESAKLNGKYDPGLEKLIAEKIEEKSRTQIYEDPATGSKTEIVELGVSQKSKKRSLAAVTAMMEDARKRGGQAFFAVNKSSNLLYAFTEARYTETDSSGIVHKRFYRLSPDGTTSSLLDSEVRTDEKGNYEIVSDGDVRWDAEYAKVPDLIEGNNYYVTGAILPVFGRLGIEDPRVKRIEPTGKKTSFLGLEIPNSMVDQVMANFGEGDASAANSPGAVYRRIVNDGKGVDLQRDGWKLRRARVNYDTAIELVGLEGPEEARRLEQLGYGRFDRSSGKPRFFIPRTEAGVAKFLADYPVKVDEAPQVNFDSDEFSPEDEENTFGITNEDEKFMLEAASMPIPKHVTKADDILMVQAEHLLSNRDFMRKLAHAVTQKARPTSDAQNVALGIYSEQCADALNAAKAAYDDQVRELELLPPDAEQETVDVVKKSIAALRKELAGARRDFREAATAKRMGASEQGRALRSNRLLFSTADYSYAGLRGIVQGEIGTAEIPEKMDEEIGRLAENFKDLDDRSRGIAVERLKLFSQKVVNDLKAGGRKASSGPKAAGNELKRVMRNYEDALNQVQVHADEAGGTLIGMADQLYPSWGKWLKAIGEYHCFMRPEITEQEVVDAIRADLGRYLTDGIDEETVRDVLTGFGHNYRQSRYDSQRKMNDLKAQALSKRQRDYMIENGKLPPQTGMVRDEASDETRALRKEVQELKKDLDEQEGGPRALKGALASAKTRVRNTIADLENAIASGEKIERSHRTLMEDAELRELKKRRDELREEYDALFGEKSTMTDEQRLQRTEKMLRKSLERAIERLAKAQAGDFSTAPRVRLDNATTMQLREEIDNTNRIIRNLKDAAYPMGTPEEIARRNANRMKRREEAIQRLQARIISGDVRPLAKPVPEMPKEMQARYDELGSQMKAAHRKLQQLREEARHATWFAVPRAALDGFNYLVGSIMTNAASYDRSAVLRQALRLTAANPVEASKAYVKAEKAAWSEDYFNEVNDKLLSDPIIDEGMKKHGLRLHSTDIAHIHTVELFKTPNTVEPRFVTRIGQMIGGIPVLGKIGKGLHGAHTYIKAGSERHYVTYLNLMAGQTYKLLVDAVPGGASDFQKRKFAGLVNILTGAASIPENLRHGINMVNTIGGNVAPVIWSPSLWVSQIQQVGLADVWGAYIGKKDDVKPGANAYAEATYVAKEAMKLRIRAGLAIAALGALLSYAFGNDDWWNELVADARRGNWWRVWNKIHHPVIGKTHIDLEMGERAFSRTLGALVTGKTETSTGRTKELGSFGAGDWYNMFGRYVGGKFSPAYGGIVSLLQGRDYIGNPYGVKEFASSWIPLSVGDVFQSAMEDSWLDGTAPAAMVMTMLGAGGSVYDEKYYERTVNPFLETVKEIENTRKDRLLDESDKKEVIDNILMSAGGIFSDNLKWRKAYGLAQQISAADNKLKSEFKKFETALESGRKLDEASIMRRFEDAEGKLNVRKRELMDMIQQGKDNYLRPWRR